MPPLQLVQSTVQVGGPTPKAAGRQLDGRPWDQMPALAGSTRKTVSEHADQIVVLDHVVEASDHASLTASQGRYSALAA